MVLRGETEEEVLGWVLAAHLCTTAADCADMAKKRIECDSCRTERRRMEIEAAVFPLKWHNRAKSGVGPESAILTDEKLRDVLANIQRVMSGE